MRDQFAFGGLCFLLGAGLALAAVGIVPEIIHAIGALSENEFRTLHILVTGVGAFVGFYVGTRIKHDFDLKFAEEERRSERQALATELLAELQYAASEMLRAFEQIENYGKDQRLFLPVPELTDLKATFVSTLPFPNTPVFEASIGRLGILGLSTAGKVVHVFSQIAGSGKYKKMIGSAAIAESSTRYEKLVEHIKGVREKMAPDLLELERELQKASGRP